MSERQRLCLALSRCWEVFVDLNASGASFVSASDAGKLCVFSSPSHHPSWPLTSPAPHILISMHVGA